GPGTTRRVEIPLTRAVPMAQLGYYPGDPHLHIPRQTERDEETILDLLAAEDIRYGAILGFNEPAGPYAGFMGKMHAPQRGLGARSARSRGDYSILSGQEYRSNTYGHLLLFLRADLVFGGQSFNADRWPVFGDVARATREQGGL